MPVSRREILKGIGAVTVAAPFTGCGDDGAAMPPLPTDIPEYEFSGTPGPATLFEHGVASGDPLFDAIVLWTRVSPASSDETIEVWWEMALDTGFTQRVAQGTVMTDASVDFTAKIDVRELLWGRNYYYRFFAQGIESPMGRTRLAPTEGDASRLRVGVCSCSSLAHGYFHAYRNMAARDDLDLVLHLGDYIYEYGNGGFGDAREYEPPTEIISLDDYRLRYSQYRREPELQELHRQVPFVVVWDDHETANNSYRDGAENHQPETEGDWNERKAVATQAYFEWLPIRGSSDGVIYRTIKYGDLADFIMMDTRIAGREEQGEFFTVPGVTDSPTDLLGAEQEAWVASEIEDSTARWRILGNQVVMGLWKAGRGETASYVNGDQWNGYPAARERFVTMLRDMTDNVVVVTGDVHSSWALDVTLDDGSYDPETGNGSVAVEFVAPGITSPGASQLKGISESSILPASPHAQFADYDHNGYFVLDITAEKVQADWYWVDGIDLGQGAESFARAFAVMNGQRFLAEMTGPETSAPNQPELAPSA